MMLLQNKHLVIIGGTTGLGLSGAKAFIAAGANVVVLGRNEESVSKAQQLFGGHAIALQGDAMQEGTADKAIATCIEKFGSFDGLYHVAGGSGRKMGDGPLHELTLDAWYKTMDINLTSLMLSNRAAIKSFLQQGKGGTILNMSSVLAFSPAPDFFSTHSYAAAKSAIIGFSKSIAAYYVKNNIRVNVIAPAVVETPMAQRAVNDEKIRSFIHQKQPLDGGRVGQTEDLDGLAVYFMSDQSKFTTGQMIAVDGGWSTI